jgi:hypothetical protein
MSKKLYNSGIKKPLARNTLAKANERRNWRIYADFSQVLIAICTYLLVAITKKKLKIGQSL